MNKMFFAQNVNQQPNNTYGKLYNYLAVSGGLLAPSGWRVATTADWFTLITDLGGFAVAGGKLKERGFIHWETPNSGAINAYNFSALPGGHRYYVGGEFTKIGQEGKIWTSTNSSNGGYAMKFTYDSVSVSQEDQNYRDGFSVRLIKTDSINPGAVSDYDGFIYPTVKIGSQVWTTRNLEVTHYNNGNVIPNVVDNATWISTSNGAWCYYNNMNPDIPLTHTYGYLYNWHAVNTGILAPSGWHVPTNAEWAALIAYLGGNTIAGGKLKETSGNHWLLPNEATNDVDFYALGGSNRNDTGNFGTIKQGGYFWTSTPNTATNAYYRYVYYYDTIVNQNFGSNKFGLSVRLIKNDSTNDGYMVDIDNNIYPTVKIGNQVWCAQNLKVTKYNNGTTIPSVENNATWSGLSTGARCAHNNNYSII